MKNIYPIKLMTMLLLLMSSAMANATLVNPATCSTDAVTLDSIQITPGFTPSGGLPSDPELLSTSYNATSCIGIFGGNDDAGGLNDPGINIGQFGDGLLNGEGGLFDGTEFVDETQFQALDPDKLKDDPGWIHLAHFDPEDDDGDGELYKYSKSGPVDGLTLNIEDLLTITFTCSSKDDDGNLDPIDDCSSITWELKTEPDIITQVQNLLGPATFDHLAFTVKSGNGRSGGGWGVYDFDFTHIFTTEANPYLNPLTPYVLSGSLDTRDFGGKGISHINVLARDPLDTFQIPEPNIVGLAMLGLLLLAARIRYNAR